MRAAIIALMGLTLSAPVWGDESSDLMTHNSVTGLLSHNPSPIVASNATVNAHQLHCVILIPRKMWPEIGIHDPSSKDYASVVWEDDDGHRSSYQPYQISGCIIKEPSP